MSYADAGGLSLWYEEHGSPRSICSATRSAARSRCGLRDPGWDGSHQGPQLAVLPGMTHYDILDSPLFVPAVAGFLRAP